MAIGSKSTLKTKEEKMRKRTAIILLVMLVPAALVLAGGQRGSGAVEQIGDISKIAWDKPMPMRDRVDGEKYVLPEGWEEATEGIEYITFTNSGALEYDPAMAESMKIFEELTGIEARAMVVPESILHTKQSAILRAESDRLDLVFMTTETENYIDYVKAGWLEPCDILWNDEIRNDFPQAVLDALEHDGSMYAFMYICGGAGDVLHYRKDFLAAAGYDRPPETFEELVEYAQTLTKDTDGDGQIDVYGMAYNAGERYATNRCFNAWAVAMGHEFVQNGRIVYNSPEAVQALQLMVDMRNKYKVVPPGVNTYGTTDVGKLMAGGKLAMGTSMSMNWQFIQNVPEIWEQYSMTHIPLPSKGAPRRIAGGPSMFGVSAFSKKKAAAMLYLDFLRSMQAATNEWLMERNGRCNKNIWNMPGAMDVPFAEFFRDCNQYITIPVFENRQRIVEMLHAEVSDALLGKKTAQEALDSLQGAIDLLQD